MNKFYLIFLPFFIFSFFANQISLYSKDWREIKLSTTTIEIIKRKIENEREIRGIHLTSWVAGSDYRRKEIIDNIKNSVINTVVVAVKEKNGAVYINGVGDALKYGTYVSAIKDPEKVVSDFKKEGIYTVARIVCFHDDKLPDVKPEFAVKNINGGIWKTRKGNKWVDPYNRAVWEYILEVAKRAAEAGFEEIQFDYVRYPTEGKVSDCVYSKPHNKKNATRNIADFLRYMKKNLSKYGVKISADVFGLTTSSDLGIGQDLMLIAENVDYVYPMMYPSHYYHNVYDIKVPELDPYKTINRGLIQAMNNLGVNYYKIRPYLQDFSLKVKYTPHFVRAQILAVKKNYLKSWVLWNPSSRYSWDTLRPEIYCAFIEPDKCSHINSENN